MDEEQRRKIVREREEGGKNECRKREGGRKEEGWV